MESKRFHWRRKRRGEAGGENRFLDYNRKERNKLLTVRVWENKITFRSDKRSSEKRKPYKRISWYCTLLLCGQRLRVALDTGAVCVAHPSYFADIFAVLIEMNERYSCVQKIKEQQHTHNRQNGKGNRLPRNWALSKSFERSHEEAFF